MEAQRLPIGFRVGFNDEDIDFGSQPVSRASSARSFSTASSCDPFTPTSGRSTPNRHQARRSAMEDFEPVLCSSSMGYEMTPPTSDLGGYYPVDVKSEYAPSSMSSENMISTPMRKIHLQDQMIDFDFNHVLGNPMQPSGAPYDSTNPHALQHYPLHESMASGSPPMALSPPMGPTPSYTFNQEYDEYPAWPPQMTESHPLDCNFYNIPEPSSMHIHLDTRANAPTSVLRSNAKRKVYMDNAQRRGTSLQKVHGRNEVKKDISEEQIPVSKIPKAMHVCDFPGCEKQTAFKRREHLRRHQNTKHGLGVEVTCEFCPKKFNRRDNWRQHLRLHTEPNRPMTRTNYHKEAVHKYEEERNNTKRRRPPMKRQQTPVGEV
ncbi:hypothetical protein PG993_007847 [Apiospora rasikravindrae]|uniref:C2H2-type domain-containing protein n=1 Tax=Apiospora rasikravindrae TaxID=990691 RepID=A0ABR1SYN5_9PEZI